MNVKSCKFQEKSFQQTTEPLPTPQTAIWNYHAYARLMRSFIGEEKFLGSLEKLA